jgi:DNA-binding transcriptional LysR family regulator
MANLDLNDIAVFVKVLQRGGFAAAARELGVPTSTVSRTVARLEKAVGVRLVQRTTRSFGPTAEGRAFFTEVCPPVMQLHQAARVAGAVDPTPHGRLRVTAPNDLGSTLVADAVSEYVARYPEVSVEVDLSVRVVDLVAEGYDVAIRAGRLADSSLAARKVGTLEAVIVGSPAYVARRGTPQRLDDLSRHALVLFRAPSGRSAWMLRGPEGEVALEVKGHLSTDDFAFVRAATLKGAGLALLPRVAVAPLIRVGELVRVLETYEANLGALYVVHPSTRHVPAKVTAFRDIVVEVFERNRSQERW